MTDDKKSPEPFATDATYETVYAAIKVSEKAIAKIFCSRNNIGLYPFSATSYSGSSSS